MLLSNPFPLCMVVYANSAVEDTDNDERVLFGYSGNEGFQIFTKLCLNLWVSHDEDVGTDDNGTVFSFEGES